jgi:hypothetical protein
MSASRVTVVAGAVLASMLVSVTAVGKEPGKSSAGKAVMVSADELKWVDLPDVPGVKTATVWGNPAKGPHRQFHKFPAGFAAPLHSHTADHSVVVVSGTLVLGTEGEADKRLGPGSYFEFTGKKKHTTKCEAGADCVLYSEGKSAWNVVMADAPKK